MTKQREYPTWICHDCGIKYCNGLVNGGKGATYHIDTCDCCGAEDVPCTEPRDYGGLKEWPLPREVDPMPLPQTLEDLIDPVLKYFDFERVHACMTHVKWWWYDGEGPDRVPTIEQLRAKGRELLLWVCKTKGDDSKAVTSTGGLVARRFEDGISLQFVAAESDVYLDDFS